MALCCYLIHSHSFYIILLGGDKKTVLLIKKADCQVVIERQGDIDEYIRLRYPDRQSEPFVNVK